MSHAVLPDDIETLKRLVIGRDAMIAKLMVEIARLKRWRFGRSAERMDATLQQLQLLLDDLQVPAENNRSDDEHIEQEALPVEESTQASATARVTRLRRAPRALPAHLPHETIVHLPASCHCPDCGAMMRKLGEDIAEMLDFVPGYFKVLRHVRPKFSCGHCARIIQLPAPSRPIERGLPGPGLLAQVIVAKYADHCPLYRQQAIYRRAGVDLERATLADWVGAASRLLEPLVQSLGKYVRAAEKLHADDTPVPVLDPGRGKTKTGRLWTYVRDDRPAAGADPPAVWYRYSPDRKGEHPQRICATFAAFCRPTPIAASRRCTRRVKSLKLPAGRTRGASSMTCTWRIARQSPLRPSGASVHCIESSGRFAAAFRPSACWCGNNVPGRCSMRCSSGCRRRCRRYRRNLNSPGPSGIHWYAGRH